MNLKQLSNVYKQSAEMMDQRIKALKRVHSLLPHGKEKLAMGRRINILKSMQSDSKALAWHLSHYYDKGVKADARYTI